MEGLHSSNLTSPRVSWVRVAFGDRVRLFSSRRIDCIGAALPRRILHDIEQPVDHLCPYSRRSGRPGVFDRDGHKDLMIAR